jgi:hypothetical protein|tara:strand:- start:1648 stop:1833 length:186 start_codon:yes stop_codon:yes gene_type:complete
VEKYKMDKLNEIFDFIIEWEIATEDEIQLVTKINGWNEESLNDIIYVKTGYRDMEQMKESE